MQLIKNVVEIGNGAAVYVPKEYIGKEVVITLAESLDHIKKRVITALVPHMPNIVGVYLYGSYARGEQERESDVDVCVITAEKDEQIKNVLSDMDTRVITLEALEKTFKEKPLFIIPLLREAQTIMNPSLLQELRTKKIEFSALKEIGDEIKRTHIIIKQFIELDEEDIAASHVYSLIMRIRLCHLIECALNNKPYSNHSVANMLKKQGLTHEEIEEYLGLYRAVRNGTYKESTIVKEKILKLLTIGEKYLQRVEHEARKKT
jgi:predicted nucleotidyltransferase